jgi:hypothetical protein
MNAVVCLQEIQAHRELSPKEESTLRVLLVKLDSIGVTEAPEQVHLGTAHGVKAIHF